MKKFLLVLLLITVFFITNRYIQSDTIQDGNCTNCKVKISTTNRDNRVAKFTTKKINIAPITIQEIKKSSVETTKVTKEDSDSKEILNSALREIVLYKKEKNRELKEITKKMEKIKAEFALYKKAKSREIKKLKSKLNSANQKLKRLLKHRKSKKRLKKYQKPKEYIPNIPIENLISEPSSIVSLREIVIEDETNIFDLAIRYYGNRNEYDKIYQANRNVIGRDLNIRVGMRLQIPIEENYDEKPIILNID